MNRKQRKTAPILLLAALPSWLLATENSLEVEVSVDIESVAQLAISGDELQWSIAAPTTPGGEPTIVQDTLYQYVQYSSVLDSRSSPRTITLARKIGSSLLMEGLVLHITPEQFVGSDSGGGLGDVGSAMMLEGGLLLGNGVVAENIETAWTGNGPGEGLRIQYRLDMNKNIIHELEAGLHNGVELVFTMTESL